MDTTAQAKVQAAPTSPGSQVEPTGQPAAPSAALEAAAQAKPRRGRGPRDTTAESPETAQNATSSPAPQPKGPSIDPALITASVEAILISVDRPIPPAKIADAIAPSFSDRGQADAAAIRGAVELLNQTYASQGRSFRIEPVSGGLRLMSRPEYAEVLARFHGQRAQTRLSRAAIETLAIIAYKQPITRAEIEAIRGVASGEILRTLMERRLVTITGRAEELGRPMLYGTTRQFLELFGLAAIKDLPPPEEFGLR
jgi:segregation and condensation protein B